MFGKRLNELTKDDIQRLISEKTQEGADVEFKETLPTKKGDNDPWLQDQSRIGDRARNEIIEEVIAFANAYGGTLVIGIQETREKPARAQKITPLPKCMELADRIRLQCRDCIDPQIPILDVAGVVTRGKHAGVVVIHVPKSNAAPHRHSVARECFIRRADRSEKMTMREIQDLTLQVDRGLSAIEKKFQKKRDEFLSRTNQKVAQDHEYAFAMRSTLVPLSPISVEKVHNIPEFTPPSLSLRATINGGGPFELVVVRPGYSWKPIIRGTQNIEEEENGFSSLEISCDGVIEYQFFRADNEIADRPSILYPGWAMGLLGNSLLAAERFRRGAGAPEIEYGLEFEINNLKKDIPVGRYGGSAFYDSFGPLKHGRYIFPRYSVGPVEGFSKLINLVESDFWNAVGHDFPDEVMDVDFDTPLIKLGLKPE